MGQLELAASRATLTVRAPEIPGETALDLKAVWVEHVGWQQRECRVSPREYTESFPVESMEGPHALRKYM